MTRRRVRDYRRRRLHAVQVPLMASSTLPFGVAPSIEPSARAAIRSIIANPAFELVPVKDAIGLAEFLPPGANVSVTASPAKGMDPTIELCVQLHKLGYVVVPHLSARMIRDRSHLIDLLQWMSDAGVVRAFVVGGDAKDPGAFKDGLSLLRAMADLSHGLHEVGVPCYPQGHHAIPNAVLLAALEAKAPLVNYMTTQMCFDAKAIGTWLRARRAEGLDLPVVLGIPGAAEPQKLVSVAARIGVSPKFERPGTFG